MIVIRKSAERGHVDHGWLQAKHSFSFANYHDPAHMGFASLRVLNEDRIAGGAGFPMHGHRDMEILTYIIRGGLEHRDSMGNGAVIRAGEFQLMSAGSGVRHSEANASPTDETHLLQIWLMPSEDGVTPGYEQKAFERADNELVLIASPQPTGQAFVIHQDACIYSAQLASGARLQHPLDAGRSAWIQVIRGTLELNGLLLEAGDGARITDESKLAIDARTRSELLLFDMA